MSLQRAAVAAFLALLLGAPAAVAHDQPFSALDLHLGGDSLSGRILAHVVDLGRVTAIDSPESLLDLRFANQHREALVRALRARLNVRLDGRAIEPIFDRGIARVPDRPLLLFTFHARGASAGRVEVRGPLFTDEVEHQTYLDVYEGEALTHQAVLDAGNPEAAYFTRGRQSLWRVLRTFTGAGIHHIFIGPDHVLFVIGLLLLGGGVRRLVKIVTSFTVAHSLTLALATLHVVNPPSRVIEPAIALSIVAVGVENLRARNSGDHRAWIAFAFGLVHGFGFASVLEDFGLPRAALGTALFAFNLGVELGQLTIVLAVAPLLSGIRWRWPRVGARASVWGSVLVTAAGSFWLVQRIFFAS
ncbi:MAG TPA: HupE/UreJ family protein [Candidatus Sulfotelmatobacter sp.]|nr:HupE/UreJ family protein [Candidatus Sulfotelmatobacter sp.]